eukprot:2430784-Amphidinium_carterae.1
MFYVRDSPHVCMYRHPLTATVLHEVTIGPMFRKRDAVTSNSHLKWGILQQSHFLGEISSIFILKSAECHAQSHKTMQALVPTPQVELLRMLHESQSLSAGLEQILAVPLKFSS